MKKVMYGFLVVFVLMLSACGETTEPIDETNPCNVDVTSDECKAMFEERTVFEYTDMAIEREMIYDFSSDASGWELEKTGSNTIEYDDAKEAIVMSVSNSADAVGAYMFNRISIPKEITHGLVIRYKTETNGAEFRVRIMDRFNEEHILSDWETYTSTEASLLEFDLSHLSGQTIVVYIEQRAQSDEQTLMIEDVRFGISGSISTKTSWTFDTDLEDWVGENNGKAYDHSEWQDGHVYLDGSDFGLPESPVERNSWLYNMFQLPEANTITLSFDIWANSGAADADFLIRVFDENVQEYVLTETGDWETFESPEAYRYTVDLTAFAGQRIAIFLEQDDDGEGSGEGIYIDNINLEIVD